MGKPEDLNEDGPVGTEAEKKEPEARAKKVDLIPAETKTAFENEINQIEDLGLLSLAQKYLAGVANITKDNLGAFMKNFMTRNKITDSNTNALKLIRTINACLFLDDKHGARIADMTIFISQKETELKAKLATTPAAYTGYPHMEIKIMEIIKRALKGFGKRPDSFRGGLHAKEVAKYIGSGPDPYALRDDLPESARPPLSPKADGEDNK